MITQTLDLFISFTTIILIASLLLSSLIEIIASYKNQRGLFLKACLKKLFDSNDSSQIISMLYSHPDIQLLKNDGDHPSYIPDDHFARALLDSILDLYLNKTTKIDYNIELSKTDFIQSKSDKNKLFYDAINFLQPSSLKTILLNPLIDPEDNDYLFNLTNQIKIWYKNYNDRTTGWYKRKVQKNGFKLALAFCVFFNFNVISIFIELKNNTTLQQTAISLGEKMIASNDDSIDISNVKLLITDINNLKSVNFPFGYKVSEMTNSLLADGQIITAIRQSNFLFFKELWSMNIRWHTFIGWILSAMMLMIQSSFWFDLLVSMFNIRKTGTKPLSTTNN